MSLSISSNEYPTASRAAILAIAKPVAFEASALDRDTRGFISMTTISSVTGLTANWTLEPPVSTPTARIQAIAVIRAVGVETGGSNVPFAGHPGTGGVGVLEMNPRVSRSSALASKATGFPIAKIAARLAVGYRLDEIPNDITRRTPASFEPALDYVVVKWPRFAFEKFPGVDAHLTTHMKSVGEVMAIGRTFRQAFAKARRSRELDAPRSAGVPTEELLESLESPSAERFDVILELFGRGVAAEQVRARTGIDPWYLRELALLATEGIGGMDLVRTYRAVDTCAAEFEA